MTCPVCADPTCIEEHFKMSENLCHTCIHNEDYISKPINSQCDGCVGFKNYDSGSPRWTNQNAPSKRSRAIGWVEPMLGRPYQDPDAGKVPTDNPHKLAFRGLYRPASNYNVKKALGFLDIARAVALKSKDRSTQVGVLFLDPNFNIRSTGWNGFPRGVSDKVEERHKRPAKYMWTCHSEENGVAQAARVGVSLDGCTALVTALHPCTVCSRMMIQAGIVRILAPANPDNDRWNEQEAVAIEMLEEAGVEVVRY